MNAEHGDINTEAYSTPKPPDETMKFDTYKEDYDDYKLYALRHGFGIRLEYRKTKKGRYYKDIPIGLWGKRQAKK